MANWFFYSGAKTIQWGERIIFLTDDAGKGGCPHIKE